MIWVLLWLVVVLVVQLQNKVYLTFVDIVELGHKIYRFLFFMEIGYYL